MRHHDNTRPSRVGVTVRKPERVPPPTEDFLTPLEFAAAMGVSIRTVRNWIAYGYVRATRVGPRLIRIPSTEVGRIAVPLDGTVPERRDS